MMQDAVKALRGIAVKLTDDMRSEQLASAARLLDMLEHPLSSEDMHALIALLPDDGDTAWGLNWTILHAIEASPEWPLWDVLDDLKNEWVEIFRIRLANGGMLPPASSQ